MNKVARFENVDSDAFITICRFSDVLDVLRLRASCKAFYLITNYHSDVFYKMLYEKLIGIGQNKKHLQEIASVKGWRFVLGNRMQEDIGALLWNSSSFYNAYQTRYERLTTDLRMKQSMVQELDKCHNEASHKLSKLSKILIELTITQANKTDEYNAMLSYHLENDNCVKRHAAQWKMVQWKYAVECSSLRQTVLKLQQDVLNYDEDKTEVFADIYHLSQQVQSLKYQLRIAVLAKKMSQKQLPMNLLAWAFEQPERRKRQKTTIYL